MCRRTTRLQQSQCSTSKNNVQIIIPRFRLYIYLHVRYIIYTTYILYSECALYVVAGAGRPISGNLNGHHSATPRLYLHLCV